VSTLKRKDLDLGGTTVSIRQLGVGEFCDAAEAEEESTGSMGTVRHAVEVVALSTGIEAGKLSGEFSPGVVIGAYQAIMAYSMEGIPAESGKAPSP